MTKDDTRRRVRPNLGSSLREILWIAGIGKCNLNAANPRNIRKTINGNLQIIVIVMRALDNIKNCSLSAAGRPNTLQSCTKDVDNILPGRGINDIQGNVTEYSEIFT